MPKCLMNRSAAVELERQFQVQAWPWRALGLGLALALGCAPVPLADGERREALRQATEQVIVPTYSDLAERTAELSELLDELALAPEQASLSDIREQYLATRAPLAESQAFGFGPAETLRSAAAIDQQPIDGPKIEAELAGTAELTVPYLSGIGANKRGLHAVEYLLFPEDDAELEAALLDAGEAGARRRQFLAAAGALVANNAGALRDAWAPGAGDYGRRFAEPGGADSVSADVQAGLDTLLNEVIFLSEVVANTKLGKPLGSATGGAIDPSAQESERSGASLSDALGNLRGVRNVYLGSRDGSIGPSLSTLVRAKSPATDLRARQALDEAEASLRAVPEPFTVALTDSPELVTAALEAVKTLKRLLATEVLGTLGASLKFNDNDGD
jgi:putative iron-regulated protein